MAKALLAWYDGAKREMPWRQTRDPYAIWVSETMLQQTQVATVVPYYRRFLEKFPTVSALAAAELAEVLALWAGLGYYRRAKHLHAGAREVVARHGGKVPGTFAELLALPGIGRYTAGAIGSMAFGLAVPVVDGNVMRVLARVFGYGADIGVPRNQAFFWDKAGALVAEAPLLRKDKETRGQGDKERGAGRYGDVNQAVMELGATVCTPTSPRCGECPLREICVARRAGRQGELPVKGAKKAVPVVRLKALVILRQRGGKEEVLLMERPAGGLWEHMWEFPTVAAEPAASARANARNPGVGALMGLALRDMRACGTVTHQLTHRTMEYQVIAARTRDALPRQLPPCDDGANYADARWAAWPLAAQEGLPMAKVVHKIAAALAQFDAEARFSARASRGRTARGLALLDKLEGTLSASGNGGRKRGGRPSQ